MPKKILKISAQLPSIPDWLKINNSITLPLPFNSAKELAKKLLEVQGDVEIELKFEASKDTAVEIKFESKKE